MESWIFCVVLLAASLAALDGKPSYIITPNDVTAVEGESVNFTCGIKFTKDDQDTIRWSRIIDADEPYGTVIFTYYIDEAPADPNKFTSYGTLKNLILQVHNVEMADAGIYICEMIKLGIKSATANLIVLDTPVPITPATTVKAGSVAQLTCEATFSAPRKEEIGDQHMPVMQTYLDATKLTVKEEVFPGLPGTKWWVMRQTANVTVTEMDDGKNLICSIETLNPYYHLDARKSIFVQHAVSMVEVQNLADVYYVGDVINCSANGNPEPTYEWKPVSVPQTNGARTYQSQQLELTGNLIGPNTWKCVVSNVVGEKIIKETEISFEVQPNPYEAQAGESKGGGSNTVAIALGVVIPIVVIGVILLVGFLVYRRNHTVSRYKSTDIFGVTEDKTNKESEKTPNVPKNLPPNPKPPGDMKVVPPQVYDPEEGRKHGAGNDIGSGTPLLEEELRPARPLRPTPQPRNHSGESTPIHDDSATEI